ncbi:acyl-CoA dehydrogenase [Sphingomonas sp. BIUV-7]|uniref:Acyl-CoA dehydrogenase n=1 Tax=Sphingomonas natans TaxID=3063330 RepID=A0ABT8Y9M6_9SPHN|nr:acyl-CoA dehydrogenase [Sphingomonas sp. BIUV-7]MDO6414538.1 acyl-CoA dehydrogenase [Sphingomonas sp. BIUV-7]
MNLNLPDDSKPLQDMFERFFTDEATMARVRAAEPVGFDPVLWKDLVQLEAPFLRLSADLGGGGLGLFDACLLMAEAGRRIAPAPLAETITALRILGEVGGDLAREWIAKVRDGETLLTLALRPVEPGKPQFVPGAAVATAVLTFDGTELAIEVPAAKPEAPNTLGGSAVGIFTPGAGQRHILSGNADAATIWQAGIEEWKLLTSAALIGLSREALRLASEYACERVAFGQPIGSYQGIGHPLAVDVIDADGAEMFLWWILRGIHDRKSDAGASISMLFWWASRTATNAVAHAIHTFGGYGLSNEYDIQLYHRRAKSWGLALGDPEAELTLGGRRLFLGQDTCLPDVGTVEVDFEAPDQDDALAAEMRTIMEPLLDPARENFGEQNFEAHDWTVHRTMGQAGLLFPDWPEHWGGRGANADTTRACSAVWQEVGYAGLARGVTGMAGVLVQKAGTPELQEEVLLPFARGEVTSCLGFTEPSGGSDVFAAKTRAVRDGEEWIVNGQKMFTSGAELSSYVLLLARTDPEAPKHKGLTLFLVPLDHPGIEIQPVHTFMDERTNATFYEDVRIPDRYRLGDVNGGVRMMAAALSMEQGGSFYHYQLRDMIDAVATWARDEIRDGVPLIEHPATLARLARVYAHASISEGMSARALWSRLAQKPDQAQGPASKVFTTQAFIEDSADLLDLAAPASLVRGNSGLGLVEKGYRHSTATSIYGGTSEVLRSMVAEKRLGLPRSRA